MIYGAPPPFVQVLSKTQLHLVGVRPSSWRYVFEHTTKEPGCWGRYLWLCRSHGIPALRDSEADDVSWIAVRLRRTKVLLVALVTEGAACCKSQSQYTQK